MPITPTLVEIMKAQQGVPAICRYCSNAAKLGIRADAKACQCADTKKRREYVVAWLKGRARKAEFGG